MSAGGWLCAGGPAPASRACTPLEVLEQAGGAGLTKTHSQKKSLLLIPVLKTSWDHGALHPSFSKVCTGRDADSQRSQMFRLLEELWELCSPLSLFPSPLKEAPRTPLCWGCTSGIEKYSHKGHFLRARLNNTDEIQHCLVLAPGGFGGFGVTEPHKHFKMAFKAICVSVGTDPSTPRTNSQQLPALGQRKMGANVPGLLLVLWDKGIYRNVTILPGLKGPRGTKPVPGCFTGSWSL